MRVSFRFGCVLISVLGASAAGYALAMLVGAGGVVNSGYVWLALGAVLLAVCGLMALARNLRRQDASLLDERRRLLEYERAYRSAPIGLATLDRELCYVRINPYLADINGIAVQAHLGRSLHEILPDIAARVEGLMHEVMETGQPKLDLDFTAALPHAPEQMRYWRLYIFPVRGEDAQVTGLDLVVDEVTGQKRAEHALLEEARRKDEFLAMLGHELRNPLAPLQSGVELIGMLDIQHPVFNKVRQAMERQVAHLARLVDELLEGSRITRGKIELKLEVLDCATILRACAEAYAERAADSDVRLLVDLPSTPVWVKGDPVRLTQVFSNLIDNAIKYGRRGGCASVSAHVLGEQLRVVVQDDGAGIGADFLPDVFNVFAQADYRKSRGGLGLGLPIARSMVELHGGSIDVESEGEGKGTRVRVALPLTAARDKPLVQSNEPVRAPALQRVLVVDDNIDAAESISLLLDLLGCQVQVAHDATSALALAPQLRADLVMLDIGLPDMDGYALLQDLKTFHQLGHTCFAAVTGYGQEHDRRRAMDAGFEFHLTKPVSRAQLEELLAACGTRHENSAKYA